MFFTNKQDKTIKKSILVISQNKDRLHSISEYLSIKNLDVVILNKRYSDLSAKDLIKNLIAIIIDVGFIDNENECIGMLSKLLPKDIICIIFADNDSIKVRQNFLTKGLRYLHYETQFNDIFSELDGQSYNQGSFSSIQIGVFGTKGGIGASFIAYHLAKHIYKKFKTKTLLIQGANSSFNIDLYADKSFNSEFFQENDIYLYRESLEDNFLGFEKFSEHKINFMVYDQGVYAANKENIELLLSNSDCAVLVIDKELASVRKAKEIIEINEFLVSVNQGCKKMVLVLNELNQIKTLNRNDIEELLNIKIDIEIPFKSSVNEVKNISSSKVDNALLNLMDKVVGVRKNRTFKLFKRKI